MMQLHRLESSVYFVLTVKWRWRVSISLSATLGETRLQDPVSEEPVRPKSVSYTHLTLPTKVNV